MATLIDGRKLARKVNQNTRKQVNLLKQHDIIPELAVIMVGENPANLLYVHMKDRMAKRLGIKSIVNHLSDSITQVQLIQIIHKYNRDPKINGILVQSPLPKHINEQLIDYQIDPKKDVDGFNPVNMGRLFLNEPGFYPVACTPLGIIRLLKEYRVRLKGQNVVIIGASQIVGRPLLGLMINANASVMVLNVFTKNLARYTKSADIIISATGQVNLLNGSDVKPGCTIIDVGENHDANGKLVGDVNFANAEKVAGKITPVPGGVGPMTIAMLMQQTVKLCKWHHNLLK